MEQKFAVIGLGRFGITIARTLARQGAEVLAIDKDQSKVEYISDEVAYAVSLDATDIKALKAQNIQEMDAVVVAIGEDFESLLLCTVVMQDLNIKRVITRSSSDSQQLILEKIGIKEILSPEDEVGMAVAQRLLNPDIITFLPLPDEYEIAEISAPTGIRNKTIAEVKLREKYNLNLITIKRDFEEMQGNDVVKSSHIVGVPKAETVIFESDTLILMGKRKHIQRFLEINR